jgi:hypothetical protein
LSKGGASKGRVLFVAKGFDGEKGAGAEAVAVAGAAGAVACAAS